MLIGFDFFSLFSTGLLWTGFCAYMTTAIERRTRANTVCSRRGIPSNGTLKSAVNTSSKADAKAFRMELSFLRKRLVTIPRMALLRMRMMTGVWLMDSIAEAVKALTRSP